MMESLLESVPHTPHLGEQQDEQQDEQQGLYIP